MAGVLQTWRRDLGYHPHIHYIVPGGALSKDQTRWIPTQNRNYLMPGRALSSLFKGKLFAAMKKAGWLDAVDSKVWKKLWVVDLEQVGNGDAALKYLAPYIYRIALTNKRLLKMDQDKVTFRYKDTKSGKWRLMTLPVMQFIQRFLQHCLPKGFIKVRYYGFLGPKGRDARIRRVRALIKEKDEAAPDEYQTAEPLRCRHCGGSLRLVRRLFKIGPITKVPP